MSEEHHLPVPQRWDAAISTCRVCGKPLVARWSDLGVSEWRHDDQDEENRP